MRSAGNVTNVFSPVHLFAICQIPEGYDPDKIFSEGDDCNVENPCSAHNNDGTKVYLTCSPSYAKTIEERLQRQAEILISSSNIYSELACDVERNRPYGVLISIIVYEVREIIHEVDSELGQIVISNIYAWSKIIYPSPRQLHIEIQNTFRSFRLFLWRRKPLQGIRKIVYRNFQILALFVCTDSAFNIGPMLHYINRTYIYNNNNNNTYINSSFCYTISCANNDNNTSCYN